MQFNRPANGGSICLCGMGWWIRASDFKQLVRKAPKACRAAAGRQLEAGAAGRGNAGFAGGPKGEQTEFASNPSGRAIKD